MHSMHVPYLVNNYFILREERAIRKYVLERMEIGNRIASKCSPTSKIQYNRMQVHFHDTFIVETFE